MKIEFICPRKVWVKGNPKTEGLIAPLRDLGFEFRERDDGPVTYITVAKPIYVEIETMEDLLNIQKKVADPLVVMENYIEIGY